MKLFFLTATVIFLASCSPSKNLSAPDEASKDSPEKLTVKQILIVGAGSVASRTFLENLSDDMATVLEKRAVGSHFVFLERVKQKSQFDTHTLDSLHYDAYIVFLPIDQATLTLNHRREIVSRPVIYGFAPNNYQQSFTVSTYVRATQLKPVWETSFSANFDLTERAKYRPISNDIIGTLFQDYFSSP